MSIENFEITVLAIETLSVNQLVFTKGDKSKFCVYGFINIEVVSNNYEARWEEKFMVFINNHDLLNFLLIQATKRNALGHIEYLFTSYEELNHHTKHKLGILSKYSPYSESKESIFKRTLYAGVSPIELADYYNTTKKIFKEINHCNRKTIITKLLDLKQHK